MSDFLRFTQEVIGLQRRYKGLCGSGLRSLPASMHIVIPANDAVVFARGRSAYRCWFSIVLPDSRQKLQVRRFELRARRNSGETGMT